jgi:uncharacterized membrane protein
MQHYRKHKYDIIVILSVVALCVSLYLAVAKSLDITVPCGVTKGCEAVLNSRYSELMGMPLPVWGIVFNGTVLVFALLANHYGLVRKYLTWLLGAGALAALGFLFIQFFLLKQVCQYCLVTDLIAILIFLWDLNIEHHMPEAVKNLPN